MVVANCAHHFNESGNKVPISDSEKSYIADDTMRNKMTSKGLRVIAFSMRDMSLRDFESL